jgi:hypothetical protein
MEIEAGYRPHPIYDDRDIRAVFAPTNVKHLNEGAKQMVGHEFVWTLMDWVQGTFVWGLADPEDLDSYYAAMGMTRSDADDLLILEDDLDIMRVEKLDA